MLRVVSVCVAAALGGAVAMTADRPFAQSDPAAIVEQRQKLMKVMSRSFGPLVAVIRGETTDLAEAATAASAMNEAATRLADLFPEGTAAGEVEGTRAKPELWTQRSEFEAAIQAMIQESGKLAEIAWADDLDSFGEQFQMLATACGGCHEARGSDGGKFRLARQ